MSNIPQDTTPDACPYCGSTDVIRTVPEKDPFNIMVICNNCRRIVSGTVSETAAAKPPTGIRRAIAEQTVQICMNSGKLSGIKFYKTEYNKLPGVTKIDLIDAKKEVEALLQSRGLTNAVKKPNRNGCVVVLIILLLIIASIVYFFTRR